MLCGRGAVCVHSSIVVVRIVVGVFVGCIRDIGGVAVFGKGASAGPAFLIFLQKFEEHTECKKENTSRKASPKGDHPPIYRHDHACHGARGGYDRADHPQNFKH